MDAVTTQLQTDSRSAVGELLRLSGPTIAQMASYTVLQFIDTKMLAAVSDVAATAAGNSGGITFSFISFGLGTVLIVNTLVSQSFGRGDRASCGRYVWQGIWLSLLISLVVMPIVVIGRPIFGLLGHEAELARQEANFFSICLSFIAIKLISVVLGQYLIGINRPTCVMLAAFACLVSCVFTNWLLIYGNWGFPRLGVVGAAWSTNIALCVETGILALFTFSRRVSAAYNIFDWRPRTDMMRTLIKVGVPSGVQIAAEVTAWSLFMNWVIGQFGTAAMTANNFMFRYMLVSFMPAVGIGSAVTALVGRYIGAGRPDLAIHRAHVGFVLAGAYMLGCGAFFVIFRRQLIGAFSSDPLIIELGAALLICAAVYQLFDAMYLVYNSALRGAGDTFVPAIVLGLLVWTIMLGGGYVYAHFVPQHGPVGAWGVACVYGVILGLYLLIRFHAGKWKQLHVGVDGEVEMVDRSPSSATVSGVEVLAERP